MHNMILPFRTLSRLSLAHATSGAFVIRSRNNVQTSCATISYSRAFTSSAARRLRVKEMSAQDMDSLKIKQDRLMDDIHHTSQWGAGQRWGEYVSISRASIP
jgi:hypothetical protein